jgi:hypothetical protein
MYQWLKMTGYRVRTTPPVIKDGQMVNLIANLLQFNHFPDQHQSLNDIAKTFAVLAAISDSCCGQTQKNPDPA